MRQSPAILNESNRRYFPQHRPAKAATLVANPFVAISLAVAFHLAAALGAPAQSYSIDRFVMAGGSGTSAGGAFGLSGTIGQPDAGLMSGGNYSLAGGFWGAIQTSAPVRSMIIKVSVVAGEVRLRFTGIPGRIYYVDRAHYITGPWNERLAAITMPIGGVVEFVDSSSSSFVRSFYRTSTD
jgi:hypothetical protein